MGRWVWWVGGLIYVCVDGWVGVLDGWVGVMDGLDGWMDGWVSGWVRWMHGVDR